MKKLIIRSVLILSMSISMINAQKVKDGETIDVNGAFSYL